MTREDLEVKRNQAIVDAIEKSQGTIEFNLDGVVITANDIFLNVLGYSLEEVKGQHHRMFCEESYANSPEYKVFWEKLNRGEFDSGEYKRIGKNGKEVYIQATYNPIFDLSGKPMKVLKIATDVTKQKRLEAERARQAALIMEISTPVIKLWDRVIVLPVVGVIDSLRAQKMMQTMLKKITETLAKVIILDIAGVATVDTAVANHLIKIAKATKLMGCRCIVSGISPAVAETLVQLGIELGDVTTNSNLQDSLADAFAILNLEVVQTK